MKVELGYYLTVDPIGEMKTPIYGLRAVPAYILNRLHRGYAGQLWQVEVKNPFGKGYVWVNQVRNLIFLH